MKLYDEHYMHCIIIQSTINKMEGYSAQINAMFPLYRLGFHNDMNSCITKGFSGASKAFHY